MRKKNKKQARPAPTYTTISGKSIGTLRLQKQPGPTRNGPCPCGSGMKYKKCCKPKHVAKPRPRSIYKTLAAQYTESQRASEAAFIKQWGFQPNPAQLLTFVEGEADEMQQLILHGLTVIEADPKYAYAVRKLGLLLTALNQGMYTDEEQEAWTNTLAEYASEGDANAARNAAGDSGAI